MEFRSFQSRLLFFFITLLSLALVATHLFVDLASKSNAGQVISENLKTGARIFNKLMDGRFRQLSESAWLLSGDYAFKLAYSTQDYHTVLSALNNHRDRIGADSMSLISLDGTTLANTLTGSVEPVPYPHPYLLNMAADEGAAHSMTIIGGKTYQTIIVPLLAPDPVAWISIGFLVDEKLAAELKGLTGLEVSFFVEKKGTWEPIASTIAGHTPPTSKQIMTGEAGKDPVIHEVAFLDDKWLTLGIPLAHPPGADYKITAILQYSLSKALEPYKRLRTVLLFIAGVGLTISALAGIFLSRTVSRPVSLLMDQVESIEGGDYSARVSVKRKDELGALANAINNMASGLEEKDRMRSLLGKVVSHAVAEELLSKKLELGGEEREVTILFSDIRSFTTHSENMTPNETLTLLNIYLTTMAAIIDKHGGVVDKFIGDAIMALFGAPASHDDDADRALLAALEMASALEGLNVTLSSRGMPKIAVGIGINTDKVVVGNMGSLDRMNYTAIGDGVNVASRLESLTKEYAGKIIISERTLNNARRRYDTGFLGEVIVKGKNIPVKIYALNGLAKEGV